MEKELSRDIARESLAGHGPSQCFAFDRNIDRPAGYFSSVPSAITGNTLRYFTPDPLPELLRRVATPAWKVRPARDRYANLLLLRAAIRRPSEMVPNAGQAHRLMSVMFDGLRFRSMEALVRLGGSISPNAKQIREEIIFVGGPSSSAARHVYAPHGVIPELMQALLEGLSSHAMSDCDPLVATATVAAFCNYVHPFKDGNGRWSRVVALSAAATRMNAWPGMTVLAFLNADRARLTNHLFPEAAGCGLRSYLAAVSSFEDALTTELESIDAFGAATAIGETLQRVAGKPARWLPLAGDLFASGRIGIEAIRRQAGTSRRVAEGFVDRVSGVFPQFGHKNSDGLAIDSLLKNVDDAVLAAVSAAQST